MKVILDMDPGIDDALAFILALRSRELRVSAVTTVAGNVQVQKTAQNALKVLEYLGHDVPVAQGMSKPLAGRRITSEHIHGKDGLGNINLPPPKKRLEKTHAVGLIIEEVLRSAKGQVTLIATGPLTNIAKAVFQEPRVAARVRHLVSMGGAFNITPYGYGNCTPTAEFNIASDPEAARIVYNSGMRITAVGLDVTMNPAACLTEQHYRKMLKTKTRTAHLACRMVEPLLRRFGFVALHDPLAVAATIKPSLVKTRKLHVDVETKGEITRGETVVDRRMWAMKELKPNLNVCYDVDGRSFLNLFMERVIFQ